MNAEHPEDKLVAYIKELDRREREAQELLTRAERMLENAELEYDFVNSPLYNCYAEPETAKSYGTPYYLGQLMDAYEARQRARDQVAGHSGAHRRIASARGDAYALRWRLRGALRGD